MRSSRYFCPTACLFRSSHKHNEGREVRQYWSYRWFKQDHSTLTGHQQLHQQQNNRMSMELAPHGPKVWLHSTWSLLERLHSWTQERLQTGHAEFTHCPHTRSLDSLHRGLELLPLESHWGRKEEKGSCEGPDSDAHSEPLAIASAKRLPGERSCWASPVLPVGWIPLVSPGRPIPSRSPTFSSSLCSNVQLAEITSAFLPVPLLCRCLSLPLSSSVRSLSRSLSLSLSLSLPPSLSPTCTPLLLLHTDSSRYCYDPTDCTYKCRSQVEVISKCSFETNLGFSMTFARIKRKSVWRSTEGIKENN